MKITFPQHFLLIDDNPLDQFVYKKTLLKTGIAHTVTCFGWAKEALAFLTAETALQPGTILLVDIQMPEMNGFEFIAGLSELPESLIRKFHIFMLSSSMDTNDLIRARQHDLVVDILHKPLDINHLKSFGEITSG